MADQQCEEHRSGHCQVSVEEESQTNQTDAPVALACHPSLECHKDFSDGLQGRAGQVKLILLFYTGGWGPAGLQEWPSLQDWILCFTELVISFPAFSPRNNMKQGEAWERQGKWPCAPLFASGIALCSTSSGSTSIVGGDADIVSLDFTVESLWGSSKDLAVIWMSSLVIKSGKATPDTK